MVARQMFPGRGAGRRRRRGASRKRRRGRMRSRRRRGGQLGLAASLLGPPLVSEGVKLARR